MDCLPLEAMEPAQAWNGVSQGFQNRRPNHNVLKRKCKSQICLFIGEMKSLLVKNPWRRGNMFLALVLRSLRGWLQDYAGRPKGIFGVVFLVGIWPVRKFYQQWRVR